MPTAALWRTLGDPDTSRALLPKAEFAFIQPTDPMGSSGRRLTVRAETMYFCI